MASVGRRESIFVLFGLHYWHMFRWFLHFSPLRSIWSHLRHQMVSFEAIWGQKHVAFRCLLSWKRRVFVWFRCLWSSHWWFLVSQSKRFCELLELLHLSRNDERKSSWFIVFLCITILCFALLDHKFWSNVSSRIALLAGLSLLPHFQRFSLPETDACIG